jgi:chromosomal replication initiator protein
MSGKIQEHDLSDLLPLIFDQSGGPQNTNADWELVRNLLRERVGAAMYDRWFAPVELRELDGTHLLLVVPNVMHQYWIEDNFTTILNGAIAEVLGGSRTVEFLAEEKAPAVPYEVPFIRQSGPKKSEVVLETSQDEKQQMRTLIACGLNTSFSFATFVEGPNCQYSSGVAKQVAEKPGKVYNPLFLHGAVGIGKTHLMQAIGHEVLRNKPKKVVRYVTSEAFTNEYIEALRKSGISAFRNKYRKVDVLLVDDVQFFGNKDSTQEEFFHTFNELHNAHKQIVVTSDRPPSQIKNLEERLVSRFEWGLATQIESPDLEMRIAILRQKMKDWTVPVADWILEFLATKITTNVRRLEGALMRVAAHISLGGVEITKEVLETRLHDVLEESGSHCITIDVIQKTVAEHFDIRLADMTSRRRPKNIARPRQIAMYLAREMTKNPLKEIGDAFGGKDHGTVIHACKTVNKLMADGEDFRRTIAALTEKMRRV